MAWFVLNAGPPSPKSDVPLTYSLGWWGDQEHLSVTSLKCEIVESKLNLFNNKSLFRYTISGFLANLNGHFKPYISKVHISERYVRYEKEKYIYEGEITLTPVVSTKSDDSYKGQSINFSIKVEEVIESAGWGKNVYVIRCGNLVDSIFTQQRK